MVPDRETGHPDLPDEQRFLDRAYEGLEAMRAEAGRMLESVLDMGRGGTFQSRTERDIVVRTSLARLAQLDIGDQALCFGRIDRIADGHLESFHIGRLAVSAPDHEPLVVDWRAPIAEPFYRATGLDPQGLARRRHLAVRGRRVEGLEDEYFVTPDQWPNDGSLLSGVQFSIGSYDESRPVEGIARDGDVHAGGVEGSADTSDGSDGLITGAGLVLGGPGALLSALGAVRTGRMGDIVATIQREQDEIIRSPLAGVLIVQGGPGTGKTAVALHRAAYLLYTHRFPLERQGVLVVGPNPLFLRYIEQVLPSLGETGVTLSTITGLVPDIRVGAEEPEVVTRLKGDPRMGRLISRAVRTRQRGLRHDAAIPFGAGVLRLTADASHEIVAATRRRRGPHNAKRRYLENLVVRKLAEQYQRILSASSARDADSRVADQADQVDDSMAAAIDRGDEGIDLQEMRRQLQRISEYAETLDRMWPRLDPHELVHDLFGARPLLAAAGRGILSPEEQALLYRPRSKSLEEVGWTVADVALVDEARVLLGPRRTRSKARRELRERATGLDLPEWAPGGGPAARSPGAGGIPWDGAGGAGSGPDRGNGADGADEGIRAYGHIVVDEVQGLSPMQLRMIARRSLSGSMTVVGDIAQATGASSSDSWQTIANHLSPDRQVRRVELTVSYRTPAEVVEIASGVLAAAAPGLVPPRPVRRSGRFPEIVHAEPHDLSERVAEITERELAAVGDGRLAVLAPDALIPSLHRAMRERGLDPVDPRDRAGPGLAAPLVFLPVGSSNGLEFDAVVVVEPALIAAGLGGGEERPAAATPRGLRTLYVALTRPTRRLTLVHAQPLPASLQAVAAASSH